MRAPTTSTPSSSAAHRPDWLRSEAASQKSRAPSNSSEPQGQKLVYAARIALADTRMQVEDRFVDLAPGMAVTVEIKTSERRIIEYVLSPLLRYRQESYRQESLRER